MRSSSQSTRWVDQSCFLQHKIRLETPEIKVLNVALLSQASLVVGYMLTCTYYRVSQKKAMIKFCGPVSIHPTTREAWLSSATLRIFISGVSSQILMLTKAKFTPWIRRDFKIHLSVSIPTLSNLWWLTLDFDAIENKFGLLQFGWRKLKAKGSEIQPINYFHTKSSSLYIKLYLCQFVSKTWSAASIYPPGVKLF